MAFKGVFEAPMVMGAGFGLLGCVKPDTKSNEDQWVRGFSQYWDSGVYSAKNWDDTDTTSYTIASNATPTRYDEIKPFFIEVEDYRSTLGLLGVDHIERIKLQADCITQKALEKELWDGVIRIGESHSNRALVDPAATILNSGTALSARRALALLEQTIGETSACGIQGVIHMTRDVASILGSRLIYSPADGGKTGKAMTRLGTEVVIGSGYTGAGRLSDANTTASASNKWMFATGPVDVHLSKIEIVNENLGQGATVSTNTNDLTVRAVRSAAVYFDPSIFYTVRLALPTT